MKKHAIAVMMIAVFSESVYCLYRGLGMRDKARKALQQ